MTLTNIKLTLVKSGFTLIELLLAILLIGILAAFTINSYQEEKKKVDVVIAISDIRQIESKIIQYHVINLTYPDALTEINITTLKDPWGNPYNYLNIENVKGKGKLRKDKNLVPINSDFDLYSKGKDGLSVGPLSAAASKDDIVRANNGRFVGLAEDY